MSLSDIDQKINRLERLLEVSRFLGASLEIEELLQSIVNAASELSESEYSALLMYEGETKLLKILATTNEDKESTKRIRVPLENSLAGTVYTQRQSIVVRNARNDPRVSFEIQKVLGNAYSLIAVPMLFRGETIGVIETINKRNRLDYSDDDVTILETLASQAAVAVMSSLMLEEMRTAYQELEESERKKSDFIAIASHELRTPLGLILGHATTVYDGITDPNLKQQLEVIVRSATRLKKIVEDFSSIPGLQEGATPLFRKKVGICNLVSEVTASFKKHAHLKNITLKCNTPQQEFQVEGDREKLALVLSNLLENAVSYTNNNGHVYVTVERLSGYVKVSVLDNGIGIPAKDLPRIFDRFYQVEGHLRRRHGGMGLGLSVAKAMVEMHNGQIWVESVEGKGSNFSFLLPLKDAQATRPNKVPAFEPGSLV